MKTIIAIDPGKSGGIAVANRLSTYCEPMPETQGDLIDLLRNIRTNEELEGDEILCVLEQVGGFTGKKQPGSRMFSFGEGYGFIKGVIQALEIPLVMVRPQAWQKVFGLGTAGACASKTEWKNKLKAEAQRRYPQLKVTLKTADALLILDWAMRDTTPQP
jgi:crossover junction endodeoxyribonuclease RuvC